jgi:hypothetical protein
VVDYGIGLDVIDGEAGDWLRRVSHAHAPLVIMRTRDAPIIIIDAKPASANCIS